MKKIPPSELAVISFCGLFAFAVTAASSSLGKSWAAAAAAMSCYDLTVVVHEAGHWACGRLLGANGRLSWAPRPAVTFGAISVRDARVVAVAGPCLGAIASLTAYSAVIYGLQLSELLYALPVSVAVMHLLMLLPLYPDGKMLAAKHS
jgi:hypothetical protein